MNMRTVWNIYGVCVLIILMATCKYVEAAEPILNYSVGDKLVPLDSATITIPINIIAPLIKSEKLTLSWNPNVDTVKGYRVHMSELLGSQLAKFGVDIIHPVTTVIYLESDLPVYPSNNICFRLRAFNSVGVSGYSKAACTIIDRIESITYQLNGAPYDLPALSDFDNGNHTLVAFIKFKQQTKIQEVMARFTVVKKPSIPTGVQVQQELVW